MKTLSVRRTVHHDCLYPLLHVCMEHCLHLHPAQGVDVQIVYEFSFFLGHGFELQFEHSADEMEDNAALSTGLHSREKNIFQVQLLHKHTVKKMPMFGPRMHPRCFQVFLMGDYIGNGELVLRANIEQAALIVITVTNFVTTKDSLPRH